MTNYEFKELQVNEMEAVNGGGDGFLGFVSDIYDSWCNMWHDFGKNLYHQIND